MVKILATAYFDVLLREACCKSMEKGSDEDLGLVITEEVPENIKEVYHAKTIGVFVGDNTSGVSLNSLISGIGLDMTEVLAWFDRAGIGLDIVRKADGNNFDMVVTEDIFPVFMAYVFLVLKPPHGTPVDLIEVPEKWFKTKLKYC